jgi:hypothetical protein
VKSNQQLAITKTIGIKIKTMEQQLIIARRLANIPKLVRQNRFSVRYDTKSETSSSSTSSSSSSSPSHFLERVIAVIENKKKREEMK